MNEPACSLDASERPKTVPIDQPAARTLMTTTPSDPNLVQALDALEQSAARPNAARLLDILPHVERLLARGVRQADIVSTLNAHGFSFTPSGFRSTLSRLRKRYPSANRQTIVANDDKSVTEPPEPEPQTPSGGSENPNEKPRPPEPVSLADVLNPVKQKARLDTFFGHDDPPLFKPGKKT